MTILDRDGSVRHIFLNFQGMAVLQVVQSNQRYVVTTFEHNADALPVRRTDPNGHTIEIRYDEHSENPHARGRALQIRDTTGAPSIPDGLSAEHIEMDPSAYVIDFEYEPVTGAVREVTDSLGAQTTVTFAYQESAHARARSGHRASTPSRRRR